MAFGTPSKEEQAKRYLETGETYNPFTNKYEKPVQQPVKEEPKITGEQISRMVSGIVEEVGKKTPEELQQPVFAVKSVEVVTGTPITKVETIETPTETITKTTTTTPETFNIEYKQPESAQTTGQQLGAKVLETAEFIQTGGGLLKATPGEDIGTATAKGLARGGAMIISAPVFFGGALLTAGYTALKEPEMFAKATTTTAQQLSTAEGWYKHIAEPWVVKAQQDPFGTVGEVAALGLVAAAPKIIGKLTTPGIKLAETTPGVYDVTVREPLISTGKLPKGEYSISPFTEAGQVIPETAIKSVTVAKAFTDITSDGLKTKVGGISQSELGIKSVFKGAETKGLDAPMIKTTAGMTLGKFTMEIGKVEPTTAVKMLSVTETKGGGDIGYFLGESVKSGEIVKTTGGRYVIEQSKILGIIPRTKTYGEFVTSITKSFGEVKDLGTMKFGEKELAFTEQTFKSQAAIMGRSFGGGLDVSKVRGYSPVITTGGGGKGGTGGIVLGGGGAESMMPPPGAFDTFKQATTQPPHPFGISRTVISSSIFQTPITAKGISSPDIGRVSGGKISEVTITKPIQLPAPAIGIDTKQISKGIGTIQEQKISVGQVTGLSQIQKQLQIGGQAVGQKEIQSQMQGLEQGQKQMQKQMQEQVTGLKQSFSFVVPSRITTRLTPPVAPIFGFSMPAMPSLKVGRGVAMPKRTYRYTPTILGMQAPYKIRRPSAEVGIQALGIRPGVASMRTTRTSNPLIAGMNKVSNFFSPKPKKQTKAKKSYERRFYRGLGL